MAVKTWTQKEATRAAIPATASGSTGVTGAGPAPAGGAARRWWVLAVASVAQLMVVLDVTVVNIALPSAQRALAFSDADRQWVVTATRTRQAARLPRPGPAFPAGWLTRPRNQGLFDNNEVLPNGRPDGPVPQCPS